MGAGPGGEPADARLRQAIALLRTLVPETEAGDGTLEPWQQTYAPVPSPGARISATDRLSWWFRPSVGGQNPWDSFFEEPDAHVPDRDPGWPPASGWQEVSSSPPAGLAPARHTQRAPGRLAGLRLLLAEPEEELIDDAAEAVITCLYDFVHAVGRRDVDSAMECIAPDYHTLQDDHEIDRDGLAAQIKSLLDPLRDWELEVSLVDIPQPVLHPDGILIYTEIQIEAREPQSDERKSWLHRRIAVLEQQRDRGWRIAALSAI